MITWTKTETGYEKDICPGNHCRKQRWRRITGRANIRKQGKEHDLFNLHSEISVKITNLNYMSRKGQIATEHEKYRVVRRNRGNCIGG